MIGLIQAALVIRDEIRGETTEGRSRYSSGVTWNRAQNPVKFRSAMTGHWLNVWPLPLAGIIVLAICRKASRQDPFATGLPESPAWDEPEKHWDAEAAARKRPPE